MSLEHVDAIRVTLTVVAGKHNFFFAAPLHLQISRLIPHRTFTMSVRRDLTEAEVLNMFGFLSAFVENGKLRHGAVNKAAEKYCVSRRTVTRHFKRISERPEGVSVFEAVKNKRSNSGRPGISSEEIFSRMKGVPMYRRSTVRSSAYASGIAKSSLHRALKRKQLVRYRSNVKPELTDKNRLERMRFCLSHIQENRPTLPFKDMNDIIHVDEKWFFLTKVKRTYYLTPQEPKPHRFTKSKRYIPKIMFLSAVCRPRYDHQNKKLFDGKFGIWPIVHQVEAKRNSRNRPKGTMETKPLSVTAEVYEKYFLEYVLPAIRAKWPGRRSRPIFIQQDNARPHSAAAVRAINLAGKSGGWNITMRNQPPNSPDLNVLDLGIFNTIQSLQQQKCSRHVDELIQAVQEAYGETSPTSLSDTFITLQSVMREVLSNEGSNNFKIPHLGKSKNRHKGTEITRLHCPVALYKRAKTFIASQE